MMKNIGRASVGEFLGDFLVYRNLKPVDPRLPPLSTFSAELGMPAGKIPRKSEPDYARAVVYLLNRARQLDAPGSQIKRILFIGDTQQNDGLAFANICRVGNWPGLAFIGSETTAPTKIEVEPIPDYPQAALYLANRWSALFAFDRFCAEQQFPIDESTAVIIDLDKTALGARGRNAHVIDQARVQAVYNTVADLLGTDFDEDFFKTAYNALNDTEFHPFTTDNQDYLAYICLVLGGGLFELEAVMTDVRTGKLTSFVQFIEQANQRADRLTPQLAEIHSNIFARVQQGDPTPFKIFRRNEYHTTIERMGFLADDTSVDALLAQEILLTQEVRAVALKWKSQGALLFGSSDKPDEASLPTPELARQGYMPIHRYITHAVGEQD